MKSPVAQSCTEQTLFMWLTCYLENRCLCLLSTAMCILYTSKQCSTLKYYAAGQPSVAIGHGLRAVEFCDERAAFLKRYMVGSEWNMCQDVDYPGSDYLEFCSVFLEKFRGSELNQPMTTSIPFKVSLLTNHPYI